ncbi:MAG: class I SAM-dependent methyltransferase [Paludibacteraceae bacterium]
MQERHSDRKRYFNEQAYITEKYILPYVENVLTITDGMTVGEIGCGEGGNLKPFLDKGCAIVGIDIATNKIQNAKRYYETDPNKSKTTFIAEDIYNINAEDIESLDLILMRDTIEHIPDQEKFLGKLRSFLKPNGCVFFGFPPWRMPFGGHQQICETKILSILPYYHLLPRKLYESILRLGESDAKIQTLGEIKETGISINTFKKYLYRNNYRIAKETFFLINPGYEAKFHLKPRKVPKLIAIPFIRDFYTTAYYCVVKLNN